VLQVTTRRARGGPASADVDPAPAGRQEEVPTVQQSVQPPPRAAVAGTIDSRHRTDLVSRRHIDLQRVSAAQCPVAPVLRSL
jgi:hypothetical protein